MIRFYAPDIATDRILPESDSQHCVRVLRMQPGAELEVVDGRGHIYRCVLAVAHSKRAAVDVVEVIDAPKVWAPSVTVAVAPTKHLDRMEWLVEKLVEIGVDRIVPVLCRRSERRELKTERLEKIAVSAMKQSLKAVLPRIDDLTPLLDFARADTSAQRFVGYCDPSVPRMVLSRELRPATDTTVLIGPEGDFTPDEIATLINLGFKPVTLGDNRLRTETAALVACDTFQIINQINSVNNS